MNPADSARESYRAALFRLFVIQFFSWSAMFALWVYALPVVASNVLHLPAGTAAELQPALIAVSLCYAAYAALGAIGALLLPRLAALAGQASVHAAALLCGAAGLFLLSKASGPLWLVPVFTAIGTSWAAIGSIPYSLLAGLAPPGKGAFLTRLFSFSTVLPQVVTTLTFALLAPRLARFEVQLPIEIGAGSMALAALLTFVWRGHFAGADTLSDDW